MTMATTVTWWMADARTMTVRPVRLRRVDSDDRPDPDGAYLQPIRRSDRGRYLSRYIFRERWEAEVEIVVRLANGDRPLCEIADEQLGEAER